MIKGQPLEGAVTLASGRGVKSPPKDIHREITKAEPKCRAQMFDPSATKNVTPSQKCPIQPFCG